MRRATKHNFRDANEPEIIAALSAFGYEVNQADKVDLMIVDKQGLAMWQEVKVGTANDKYQRNQLETAAFSRLPFAFVKTPDEALTAAKTRRGVTEKQRQSIAIALAAEPNRKDWTPAQMRRILDI